MLNVSQPVSNSNTQTHTFEGMNTSPELDQLATALASAQGAMTFAAKEGKSHHGTYAKLDNVWDAIRPHLSANGLCIVQIPHFDGRVVLTTRLIHKSGQWLEGKLSIRPNRDDAHSIGSAISYLRRYSLSPLVGSVDSEDDDGHGAMGTDKDSGKALEKREFVKKNSDNKQTQIQQKASPDLFDMNNSEHKKWLWKLVQAYDSRITPEQCKDFSSEINGLTFENADIKIQQTFADPSL